jgi:hypothetical protein
VRRRLRCSSRRFARFSNRDDGAEPGEDIRNDFFERQLLWRQQYRADRVVPSQTIAGGQGDQVVLERAQQNRRRPSIDLENVRGRRRGETSGLKEVPLRPFPPDTSESRRAGPPGQECSRIPNGQREDPERHRKNGEGGSWNASQPGRKGGHRAPSPRFEKVVNPNRVAAEFIHADLRPQKIAARSLSATVPSCCQVITGLSENSRTTGFKQRGHSVITGRHLKEREK